MAVILPKWTFEALEGKVGSLVSSQEKRGDIGMKLMSRQEKAQ
jgi:hypothetical protein